MEGIFSIGIESTSDEILLNIFRLLPIEDILKVICVSKRFKRVAEDPCLHRRVNFGKSGENLFISKTILQSYINKHAGHLQALTLIDCYWVPPHQMARVLHPLKNLQELNIIGCEVSLSALCSIFQRNPQLRRLGWSVPQKELYKELCGPDRQPNDVHRQLCDSFGRLSSLKLRFHKFIHFETIIGLFPNTMTLSELLLEYKGPKVTSLIHDGSDYSILIKSNCPFPVYYSNPLHFNDISLHFNLNVIDFSTKVALNAAKTDQLTCLLAPGSLNILCWNHIVPLYKTPGILMVDFSSTCLTAEKINWLGNLNRLTHLNLQHVQHFKANLMKAIALNCPDLQSLNLNNCVDWVDEDLCALKIVCMSCSRLQHLNVGRICCHSDGTKEGNLICKVIAGMKHLRCLSIAPCCLVRVADEKLHSTSDGLLKKNVPRRSSMADGLDKPSGAAINAASTSSTMTTESGYVTRRVTHQKEINERVLQSGSGLDDLVKGLRKIEEVEFIGVGYSSVFSIPDESTGLSYVCPLTRNILDATLLPLKNWTHLRRLTLAGLRGLGSFCSLIEITKHCNLLEYLSLADIGLPGNSFALSSLPQALTNCTSLKKLRVDQPHYNLTEKVMAALQNCRNIESMLISCKSGKISKDIEPYIRLFDSCKKLCVFQLFSGAPMIHCRRLTKELLKRYQKLRPPLSIAILHFSQSLTGHGLQGIPFAHLKTLTCFESKIAQ